MTQAERTELNRAVERAGRNHISITAEGVMPATGERFFVTTSSSGAGAHLVVVKGASLVCDCPATVICSHRGVVHTRLAEERAAQARAEATWGRPAAHTAQGRDGVTFTYTTPRGTPATGRPSTLPAICRK